MFPFEALLNLVVIVVMVGFWLVAFVILYHLSRFGVGTLPKKLAALFLVGSLTLFTVSVIAYYNLDMNLITKCLNQTCLRN